MNRTFRRLLSLLTVLTLLLGVIPTAAAQTAIIDAQGIVDYLASHGGQLPENFISKSKAQKLGWENGKNYLSDVAPGKSIGGGTYGNRQRMLPEASGRTWRECDVDYVSGRRTGKRLCWSNDGLYFYTPDGYKTFTQMYPSTQDEAPEGPIIAAQDIADYIFEHQCLPPNFITKKEAQDLGWDSYYNYVSDVAPGMSIGGDRFGNYEGKLPTKKGRQYYECDVGYTGGKRNATRVIFSNDGLVYYTEDHYNTFTQLFPSK